MPPLPLVPIAFVAGSAALVSTSGDGHVPGAAPAPDENAPTIEAPRPPPHPYVPPVPQGAQTAGGDPSAGDPAMSVIEAGTGALSDTAKEAVVGAAAVFGATILGTGSVAGAAGAAAASIGTTATAVGASASTAASSAAAAASVVGPVIGAVGAAVGIVAGVVDIFGGDFQIPGIAQNNAAGLSDADYAHYQALLAAGGTQAGEGFLLQVQNRLGTKQITTTAGTVTLGRRAAEFVAGADPSEVVAINPVTHRPLAAEVFTKPGER